ncbi:MAG: hypothetical protein ACRBN8_21935 [Nannocystales bacterium]
MTQNERRAHVLMLAIASVATIATKRPQPGWSTSVPVAPKQSQLVLTPETPSKELRLRIEVPAEARAAQHTMGGLVRASLSVREWQHRGEDGSSSDQLTLTFRSDVGVPDHSSSVHLWDFKQPLGAGVHWPVIGPDSVCPPLPKPCVLEATATIEWTGALIGEVVVSPSVDARLDVSTTSRRHQEQPPNSDLRVLESRWQDPDLPPER